MESLPSLALESILICLRPDEVFLAAGLTSQHMRACVTDPYFLCLYCRTFLGIEREFRMNYPRALSVLRQCVQGKEAKKLRFLGFGTTGGADEDNYRFWVSNMYLDSEGGYCSRDPKRNINTVGFLEQTQSEETDVLTARVTLATKLKNSRLMKELMSEEELARLKLINSYHEEDFWGLWANYKHYFLADFRTREERQAFNDEMEGLWERIRTKALDLKSIRRYPDNKDILVQEIDFTRIERCPVVFASNKVIVSRRGNFTCPVETFLVFVSDTYVDIEAEDFAVYDNLLESADVDAFVRSPPGHNLQVSELQTADNTHYRTFSWTSRRLKPLLWGKFLQTGDRVSVQLPHYFAGCYLYTKLINPENRMTEFNDPHEECNIDVDFVGLKGYIVKCT